MTRLSSIESQPKKIVVVADVLIVVLVVVFVVGLIVVLVFIVGHRKLTLKFGQNWVNDSDTLLLMLSLFQLCCCCCY